MFLFAELSYNSGASLSTFCLFLLLPAAYVAADVAHD
jgi:hypothetical protein